MRQLIKGLSLNTSCVLPCIIQEATPRKTKAGKPYLNVLVFDGYESINGNYWDWAGKAVPQCGSTVYDVSANVSSYLGQKQLNIVGITTCTTHDITDFVPQAGVDLKDIYKAAYELASNITDEFLRNVTLSLFDEYRSEWLTVPGAKSIHHAYIGGTLVHSLSVARIALAIAEQIPIVNKDLVVAGALLHDIGKLWTYSLEGAAIDMTDTGKLYDHIFMGASKIERFAADRMMSYEDSDKLRLLVHIILAHHGSLEYGSVVNAMCAEAIIVSNADNIDASCEQIRMASNTINNMWTDRIYTLNNKPFINYQHVQNIMSGVPVKDGEDEDLPFK